MEGKNGGRGRRDGVECEYLAIEDGFGEKECENAIRPDADAAGASRGKPFPPSSSTAPPRSTYPSLDIISPKKAVISLKKAAAGRGKLVEHKVHGDSHDPTLLHDQGLGVDLDIALGADRGL
jgi:hypothetical protein